MTIDFDLLLNNTDVMPITILFPVDECANDLRFTYFSETICKTLLLKLDVREFLSTGKSNNTKSFQMRARFVFPITVHEARKCSLPFVNKSKKEVTCENKTSLD